LCRFCSSSKYQQYHSKGKRLSSTIRNGSFNFLVKLPNKPADVRDNNNGLAVNMMYAIGIVVKVA
jgi:hypothetical protein